MSAALERGEGERAAFLVSACAGDSALRQEVESLLREEFAAVSSIADPREAYRRERQRLAPDGMLVLTGSAYMIDQALNPDPYLRHTNASFGWRTRG